MPSYVVTAPNGQEFEVEAPEGATDAQILSFAQQSFKPKSVSYPDLSNIPTQNGALENLGRGYLQGGKNAIMGTLQAGTDLLANKFPESESLQNARELMAEAQGRSRVLYQANTGDSTAAKIGEFVGEAAPYALIPAGGTSAASRAALGGLGGAVAGGTAATEENKSVDEALRDRGMGTAIGGTIGAVAPSVVGSAKPFMQKLLKINPTAAKDFLDTGVQTSLATLSDRGSIKQLDRFLSKFPGGTGVIEKNTNKTLDDIQAAISRAGGIKGVTTQEAGQIIKGGGEKYVDRFNDISSKLYNRLDQFLPADTKVTVANAANQLTKELSGLPANLAARRSNNEGIRVLQDLVEDSKDGLPYSAMRTYRTIIGQKLSKPYLLGGEDEAVLKRAYGALTQDMEAAAAAKSPDALKAFKRANEFYRIGANNIEKNLQNVITKDAPEQVYRAAISGTKLGGTKVNSIMKSLLPEEREIVKGTVLKQLGTKGDNFSTRHFLTEWDKLAPEAKKAIFGSSEKDISKIADVTKRINGLDRFSNPSGTGQYVAMGSLLIGGALFDFGAAAASTLGAYTTSKLMSSPKFTRWLAKAAVERATPQNINKQLTRLGKLAEKDSTLAPEIAKYIGVVSQIATRNGE